ncbi:hypothetical protein YK48G_13440 [Lentilactobacillus fungorum]|uniref:Uncharacterized protein n=1 Tax=Lentilactobacillus fungorum TaxID=2201250 RepID=A0ABQ3VZZ1_9LACO|nr:hypothetical protein [Lentilactobacillus fungorum]GHP13919.1 hypothetical protein YK48G_13440 [Lentilactobacillus fungorum]
MKFRDDVKSFLIENSPFGYIPVQRKRVLDEIAALSEKSESFTYQYLNEEYFREVIILVCLNFALKCIEEDEQLKVQKLTIGDPIEYKKQFYLFQGHNNDGNYVLKSAAKSKNPCDLQVPLQMLERYGHKAKTTKKRRAKGVLDQFAKHFGMDLKGLTENKQIAIVLPKNVYTDILSSQFWVGNKRSFFGEICPSSYLTAGGKVHTVLHSDTTETSFILFSSSINEIVNGLDEDNLQFEAVYVFGNKWFNDSNFSNLRSLPSLAEDFHFSIALFSSNSAIFSDDSLELIGEEKYNRNWLSEYDEELLVRSVHTNIEFQTCLTIVTDSWKEYKKDKILTYFAKLIWNSLRTSTSVASINSEVFDSQISKLEEYGRLHNTLDIDELIDHLHLMLHNRFGAQMKKCLMKSIDTYSRCALVVIDDLKQEYESIFNRFNVTTFSYRDQITDDMYGRFDAIILVNPYAHEREKWTQSFLALKVIIVTPQDFLKPLKWSIQKEIRLIRKLNDKWKVKTDLHYAYADSLSKLAAEIIRGIKHAQMPKVLSAKDHPDLVQEIEKDEDEILSTDEIYLNKIKSRVARLSDNAPDNTHVNVHKVFELTAGYELYGTDNAHLFTVTGNGTILKKRIDLISKGEQIIDFEVPYSDSLYREHFKKMSERVVTPVNLDEKNDFRWKRSFLNYINRNGYSPAVLKRKMELEGAPTHDVSYYATWSNQDKMPILPQTDLFIRYVGRLIGDEDIQNNYQAFYHSSEIVKQKLTDLRDAKLASLNNKKLAQIATQTFLIGKVISIREVNVPAVPRFMTNTFLKG